MNKCNCINNLEFSREGNCFGYNIYYCKKCNYEYDVEIIPDFKNMVKLDKITDLKKASKKTDQIKIKKIDKNVIELTFSKYIIYISKELIKDSNNRYVYFIDVFDNLDKGGWNSEPIEMENYSDLTSAIDFVTWNYIELNNKHINKITRGLK